MARSIDLDTALVVLFARLHQLGLDRIREYDLHSLASKMAPTWWPQLRFITKPTVYSPALHRCLHELERRGSIDELILVHDGWAPRHEYALTRIGKIRAADEIERLRTFCPAAIDGLVREVSDWAGQLLVRKEENDRGYPT